MLAAMHEHPAGAVMAMLSLVKSSLVALSLFDSAQGSQFHLNSVISYVIARTAAQKDAAEEGRRLLQSLDPDGSRYAVCIRGCCTLRFRAATRRCCVDCVDRLSPMPARQSAAIAAGHRRALKRGCALARVHHRQQATKSRRRRHRTQRRNRCLARGTRRHAGKFCVLQKLTMCSSV